MAVAKEIHIAKLNAAHPNGRYDFDDYLVPDPNNKEKITNIYCNEHEIFCEGLRKKIKGGYIPCKQCRTESGPIVQNKQKYTKDDIIKKSRETYAADRFDHSALNNDILYKQSDKIQIRCIDHDIVFIQRIYKYLKGPASGCKKCIVRQTHLVRDKRDPNETEKERFIKKATKIHGDRYDYSLVELVNLENMVKIICKEHGEFNQYAHVHLQNHGCSQCGQLLGAVPVSKAVRRIETYFDKLNIDYEREKTFEGLMDIRKLRYDFYLPSLNILVEYDGGLHFESTGAYGGEEGLINVQKRDSIKDAFAITNNIPIVRISCKDDKRLDYWLDLILQSAKDMINVVYCTDNPIYLSRPGYCIIGGDATNIPIFVPPPVKPTHKKIKGNVGDIINGKKICKTQNIKMCRVEGCERLSRGASRDGKCISCFTGKTSRLRAPKDVKEGDIVDLGPYRVRIHDKKQMRLCNGDENGDVCMKLGSEKGFCIKHSRDQNVDPEMPQPANQDD